MLDIDPNKPDVPALARIAMWTGVTVMIASIASMMLAFSGYEWVNDVYAMAASVLAFLIALILIGQGKTIEMLAVVSARTKSRFAVEHALPLAMTSTTADKRPAPIVPQKERVIHIPESQAREQGIRLR